MLPWGTGTLVFSRCALGPAGRLATGFLWLWPGELRTLFLLTIVPGLLVVVMLVFLLREAPSSESAKEPLHLTLRPFDRNFRRYLLALVVFTLGNSSDAFLLVRAGELGVPTTALPLGLRFARVVPTSRVVKKT